MNWKRILLRFVAAVALVCAVVLGWRVASGDESFGEEFFSWFPGTPTDYRTATTSESFSFSLKPTGRLLIESTNLDIRIVASTERGNASVDLWLVGQSTDPDRYQMEVSSNDSSTLRILAHPGSDWDANQPGGGKLVITLPAGFDARVTTVRGSLLVEGMNGRKAIDVTGGDVALVGGEGEGRVGCRGGNISMERYRGTTTLEAPHGRIATRFVVGRVRARAGEGIQLHDHAGGFALSTDRSAVVVDLISVDSASQISTIAGDITLAVAPSAAITLDATTQLGNLVAPPVPGDSLVNPQTAPRSIHRDFNGGGVSIRIESVGGGIRIKDEM